MSKDTKEKQMRDVRLRSYKSRYRVKYIPLFLSPSPPARRVERYACRDRRLRRVVKESESEEDESEEDGRRHCLWWRTKRRGSTSAARTRSGACGLRRLSAVSDPSAVSSQSTARHPSPFKRQSMSPPPVAGASTYPVVVSIAPPSPPDPPSHLQKGSVLRP